MNEAVKSYVVYVVDAWDDDAQESYVRVFSTVEKAKRDLARWEDILLHSNRSSGSARGRVFASL